MREKFIKRKFSVHLNVLTVSNIMNKYESSGLGQYQLHYATNAMKQQRAAESRKCFNPLYPHLRDGKKLDNNGRLIDENPENIEGLESPNEYGADQPISD